MSLEEIAELRSALEKVEPIGQEWVLAKSRYEDLEDKKKSLLASLMPKEGSQALKEQEALKTPEWTTFLQGLGEARKDFLKAQVAYDMAKLKIDVLRSILSTRRTEIQNFRG